MHGGGQKCMGAGQRCMGPGRAGRDAWGAMQNHQVSLGNAKPSGELTFQ
jgi:hypothetical protein